MPVYEEVRKNYGEQLINERKNRYETVALLEKKAHNVGQEAAQRISEIRSEAAATVKAVQQEAEAYVLDTEQIREKERAAHYVALRNIEEALEADQRETEQRLRQIEQEAFAIHDDSCTQVASVCEQRSATVKQLREQAAEADRLGEERCILAGAQVKEIEAAAHAAIRAAEAKCSADVEAIQQRCETLRADAEASVLAAQRRAAQQIEEFFLPRVAEARQKLAERREVLDQEREKVVMAQRDDLAAFRQSGEAAVEEAKQKSREALDFAIIAANDAEVVCWENEHRRRQSLKAVSDEISAGLHPTGKFEHMKPLSRHVAGLEELASRLRSGLSWRTVQAPTYTAEHLRSNPYMHRHAFAHQSY